MSAPILTVLAKNPNYRLCLRISPFYFSLANLPLHSLNHPGLDDGKCQDSEGLRGSKQGVPGKINILYTSITLIKPYLSGQPVDGMGINLHRLE
jgi:hypothetical protein